MNDREILQQAIALISRLMGEMEAEAFEQEGFSNLSMRQLLYLETIAQLERPTFSELADQLDVTKPSVTALVKKLMKMGYVKKVQSQEDLRVYHIVLTAKGKQFTEMHDQTHRLLAERLTQNLNEQEIHQMAVMLKKVITV
jgi:DNA-binding MarR family transcriptional regulator